MAIVVHACVWFALAVLFALVEIEGEGKYGWAEKMPTWYRTTGFAARVYGLLMGGKPLTGYHAAMFILPLVLMHTPFVGGVAWSPAAECWTFALYLAWAPVWDFLWFVLNPYYGFSKFRRELIWWHAKSAWYFGLPSDYWKGWAFSVGLAYGAERLGRANALQEHTTRLGLFVLLTGAAIILSIPYHIFRRWMDRKDDRDKAGIFHKD